MRKSAKWMVLADERILEYLSNAGPAAPSKIAEDERIVWGRQHVGNRCRKLASFDLVREVGNGVYTITEVGESYLAGNTDAKELAEG